MKIRFNHTIRQKVWGWPVVANFILAEAAGGFYILSFLKVKIEGTAGDATPSVAYHLLVPAAMVCLGFICLKIKSKRSLRACDLLRSIRTSWMSREFLAGTLFVAALFLTSLFPHPVLRILGAGAALGLMLSQGFIVYSARGVPAWNVAIIPLVFLTSGFVSGGGLMFVLLDWATTERSFAVMGIVCVAMNLVIWLLYLHWSFDREFRQATEALRRPNALIVTVGVGHFLPVCLLFLVVMRPGFGSGAGLPAIATSIAALAMITGSFRQNADIILKAGYKKEIAFERTEKGTHL